MIYSEGEIERIARVAGESMFGNERRIATILQNAFLSQAGRALLYRAPGRPLFECNKNGVGAEKCR